MLLLKADPDWPLRRFLGSARGMPKMESGKKYSWFFGSSSQGQVLIYEGVMVSVGDM